MSQKTNRLFLVTLIVLALVGATLILSVPPLFSPHETYQLWLTLILGGLTMALGAVMIVMRPPRQKSI